MIKQESYEKVSEVFGTIVGVATQVGIVDLMEVKGATTPTAYRTYSDEIDINDIINRAILSGRYHELQSRIWSIEHSKRSSRMKLLTIYKRAWEGIGPNGL